MTTRSHRRSRRISQSPSVGGGLGNGVNVDLSTGLTVSLPRKLAKRSERWQDSYCRFINCGESCPSGLAQIARDDKKSQLMLESTQCLPGSKQTQTLCFPTSTVVPACLWRGFRNNGKCKGGCNSDETEVGTITCGCKSGYQSAGCTIIYLTKPWSECSWTDHCHSDNTCPSGFGKYVTEPRDGWGSRKSCGDQKRRNYCCKNSVPDAFTNGDWYGHQVRFPKRLVLQRHMSLGIHSCCYAYYRPHRTNDKARHTLRTASGARKVTTAQALPKRRPTRIHVQETLSYIRTRPPRTSMPTPRSFSSRLCAQKTGTLSMGTTMRAHLQGTCSPRCWEGSCEALPPIRASL